MGESCKANIIPKIKESIQEMKSSTIIPRRENEPRVDTSEKYMMSQMKTNTPGMNSKKPLATTVVR